MALTTTTGALITAIQPGWYVCNGVSYGAPTDAQALAYFNTLVSRATFLGRLQVAELQAIMGNAAALDALLTLGSFIDTPTATSMVTTAVTVGVITQARATAILAPTTSQPVLTQGAAAPTLS